MVSNACFLFLMWAGEVLPAFLCARLSFLRHYSQWLVYRPEVGVLSGGLVSLISSATQCYFSQTFLSRVEGGGGGGPLKSSFYNDQC